MDWLLRRLADRLGVEPARAGEAIVPRSGSSSRGRRGSRSSSCSAAPALIVWLYRREGAASLPVQDRAWPRCGSRLVLLAVFMLSEAVLSVERTGLPYFVVMVDDSASQQVVDQYADPKAKAAAEELAKVVGPARGRPLGRRRRGCSLKDDGAAPPRAAEAEQGPALPRLDRRPPAGRDRQARGRRAGAGEAQEGRGRAAARPGSGDGVRQVLTELRGRPAVGDRAPDRRPDDRRRDRSPRPPSSPRGRACRSTRSAWATPSRPATSS